MSYLLDTNVISESFRSEPSPAVVQWFKIVPEDALYVSVLSLGEIRKGIEKLTNEKRKNQLVLWLEHDLPKWFGSRVLSIDKEIADRWGYLTAITTRTLPAIDGLLAATALTHGLKMVTRNTKDFQLSGLEVVNPFEG